MYSPACHADMSLSILENKMVLHVYKIKTAFSLRKMKFVIVASFLDSYGFIDTVLAPAERTYPWRWHKRAHKREVLHVFLGTIISFIKII